MDDDFGEPLPIISAEPKVASPAQPSRRQRRRERRKGNTKAPDAGMVRADNLRKATGRDLAEPEEWREQLASGNRNNAATALTARKLTHGAGSGFAPSDY